MKRLLIALFSIALILPVAPTGCKAASTTTAPQTLAPGYMNAADQQMGQILAGARAFYVQVQDNSASGKMTLSATEKAAFNKFGASLNAANMIYLGYHSGANTQAQAQAAVNQVQQDQAALPIPGGK